MSTNSTVKLYNVSFTVSGADLLSSAPTPQNALTFSTLTPVKLSDKFFKIDITNFNYNDIYTKNYVQITNPDGVYYAFINGVEWLSYNCVRVDFTVDLWHTYINKCTIKSGYLERSNDKTQAITARGDITPASYTTYTNGQRIYSSDNAFLVYVSSFPALESAMYRKYNYNKSPVPSLGYCVYCWSQSNLNPLLGALNNQLERIISIVSIPKTIFGVTVSDLFTQQTIDGYNLLIMPDDSSIITNTYTVTLPFTNDEFFGCGSSPCTKVRLRVGGQSQDYAIENLDITDGKLTYYVSLAFNAPCPSISVKMKTKTVANAGDISKVLPPLTMANFPLVPISVSSMEQWSSQQLVPALFSAVSSLAVNPSPVTAVSGALNIAGQAIENAFEPPSTTAGSVDTLFSVNDFGIYIDIFVPSVAERTRIVSLYNYVGFPFNKPVTSVDIFPASGEEYRETTLKNAIISGNIPDEAKEFISNRLAGGVRVWSEL